MSVEPRDHDGLAPEPQARGDRQHFEFTQEYRGCRKAGWVWDGTREDTLVHPEDKELSITFSFDTDEIMYSPKLAEQLMVQNRRRLWADAGEGSGDEH